MGITTTQRLPYFKQGDTFQLGATYLDADGLPIDLTSITIKAQLRTASGDLIDTLTISKANQTTAKGQFSLSATAVQTTGWPTGIARGDIKLTLNGAPVSSETYELPIINEVTA